MKDPIKLGNGWFDRNEIAAVIRQNGSLLTFLKSGKTVNIPDDFSEAEIEEMIKSE